MQVGSPEADTEKFEVFSVDYRQHV
jgi:hypothetical protein